MEEQALQPQGKFNVYAAARLAVLHKHMDQKGIRLDPATKLATEFLKFSNSVPPASHDRFMHSGCHALQAAPYSAL